MRIWIPVALALVLGACTAQQAAVVNLGIEKVKAANDTTAIVLIQSTCAMAVGAYHRLEQLNYKRGVDLLCGGDGADPLTLRDLNLILSIRPVE